MLRRICGGLAVLMAFGIGGPLGAQEEEEDQKPKADVVVLDEVIVTARKVEENLQEVPISIDTLDQDGLDYALEGGADVLGIAGQVGNLYVEQSNGRNAPRFYVRGLGNTDFDVGASQPVSIVVDDIIQENAILKAFPIFDTEGVEVLRGPQGSLFGRNTTAGVLKFTSKRPTQDRDMFLAATVGNLGSTGLEFAIGGGLTETISSRLSLMYQNREDWVDNDFTGESDALGGHRDIAARLQFLYEREGFTALLNIHGRDMEGTASLFRANIIGPGNNDLNSNFDRDRVSFDEGDNNPQDLSGIGANLNLTWTFDSGMQLTSITGFENADGFALGDIDGGNLVTGPGFIPFPSQTAGFYEVDQLSQELRLNKSHDNGFSWTAGVFVFDSTLDSGTRPFFVDDTLVTEDSDSWAIFATGTQDLTDRLALTLGLRYTDDERSLEVLQSPVPSPPISVQDDELSWDASLVFEATDNTNLFGRVSYGFRGPSIQSRDVAFFGVPTTALSETVLSYEFGTKSELANGRLRLNTAIYAYTVDDQQFTAIGGDGNFIRLVNAAEGEAQGFEFDVRWLATDRFQISLGLGLGDTEIKDPNLAVAPCGSGQCTVLDPLDANGNALVNGNPFPQAPEYTYSIGLDYTIPMGDGGLLLSANYVAIGDTNFFLYESEEFGFDENVELGLRIGYAWAGQEVALWSRNVTDEENLIGGIDFNNNTGFVNEPRTYGITYKRFVF